MSDVLGLTDVSVARGGVPVLSGVSFEVPNGAALVLRGPNGSGKTTLLRTVAGLQPAVLGRIDGAGERVAYAAHADGVKGALTVGENLRFWAGVYGSGAIETALAAFDLGDLEARPARALSAGQRRRLGLARLIVTDRPLWVLDEPTVSLDSTSVGLFADAVRGHLERGGSALIATHIDLGLKADILDISPFKTVGARDTVFDEAFL